MPVSNLSERIENSIQKLKRSDLETYRDDEVTDQYEARKQRAQKEAKREVRQEQREERIEQIREKARRKAQKKPLALKQEDRSATGKIAGAVRSKLDQWQLDRARKSDESNGGGSDDSESIFDRMVSAPAGSVDWDGDGVTLEHEVSGGLGSGGGGGGGQGRSVSVEVEADEMIMDLGPGSAGGGGIGGGFGGGMMGFASSPSGGQDSDPYAMDMEEFFGGGSQSDPLDMDQFFGGGGGEDGAVFGEMPEFEDPFTDDPYR